ncbi:hypothetical protein LDENG_00199510 [Lucifuga dentata]|nr:hypothetical protein LDENG_00199510 [Lucifuga dentata]
MIVSNVTCMKTEYIRLMHAKQVVRSLKDRTTCFQIVCSGLNQEVNYWFGSVSHRKSSNQTKLSAKVM